MEPGQYVRVNFPHLSWWEWHPFTLTSVPGDAAHSVHIRAIGDWTKQLYEFFDAQKPSVAAAAASAAVEAAAALDGMEKGKGGSGEGAISTISGQEKSEFQQKYIQQRGSSISSPRE